MLAKNKASIDDDDRPKARVLMLVGDRGGGPGQRRYKVEQILDLIECHPGDYLTPDEVHVLCDARGWQVHISLERERLLQQDEWSR